MTVNPSSGGPIVKVPGSRPPAPETISARATYHAIAGGSSTAHGAHSPGNTERFTASALITGPGLSPHFARAVTVWHLCGRMGGVMAWVGSKVKGALIVLALIALVFLANGLNGRAEVNRFQIDGDTWTIGIEECEYPCTDPPPVDPAETTTSSRPWPWPS
jgi:hypothetical protein